MGLQGEGQWELRGEGAPAGAFEPQAAELPRAAHGTGSHPQLHLCSSLAAAPNSAHSPMPGKGHAKLGQRGNMEFRQRRPGAGTSSSRALSTHAKPLLRVSSHRPVQGQLTGAGAVG